MPELQDWIADRFKDIAEKLPTLVHTEPASFACGYNAGYKRALIELEEQLEAGAILRKSSCWCGDKYHDAGIICL